MLFPCQSKKVRTLTDQGLTISKKDMSNNTSSYGNHDPLWNPSVTYYLVTFITSILISALSPIAGTGNALVLAAVSRNPSLRTPSYILVGGMAATNLCVGILIQPLYAHYKLTELKMKRKPNYCLGGPVVGALAAYFASIVALIVTFISVERWLHMSRRSVITIRRAFVMYGVSIILPLPVLVFRLATSFNECPPVLIVDLTEFSILVLCIITTSVAYFKVFRLISHHQQQVQANQVSQNLGQRPINLGKCKKSVVTILCIVALFYMSYFPVIFCVTLLALFNQYSDALYSASYVCLVLFFLSFSLSPVLYCWRVRDIRNAVRDLLPCN